MVGPSFVEIIKVYPAYLQVGGVTYSLSGIYLAHTRLHLHQRLIDLYVDNKEGWISDVSTNRIRTTIILFSAPLHTMQVLCRVV